jgi:hypothetical protein
MEKSALVFETKGEEEKKRKTCALANARRFDMRNPNSSFFGPVVQRDANPDGQSTAEEILTQ